MNINSKKEGDEHHYNIRKQKEYGRRARGEKKMSVDLESIKQGQHEFNKKSDGCEERWTKLDNRCEKMKEDIETLNVKETEVELEVRAKTLAQINIWSENSKNLTQK